MAEPLACRGSERIIRAKTHRAPLDANGMGIAAVSLSARGPDKRVKSYIAPLTYM